MDARILRTPPQSGDFEEHRFDAYGECTWVKFEDHTGLEFCGVFGGGIGNRSSLARLGDRAFVISAGQGYIVDIRSRSLVHQTKSDDLVAVASAGRCGRFAAHDLIKFFVYDNGLIWASKRISADGIIIDEVRDDVVFGKVFDFEDWVGFSLDLATFEYECDWQCPVT